jgi:hypothetical protein
MARVSIALTVLAASLLSLGLLLVAGTARAESPNGKAAPIYVLSILTDDADDQADALTQALRARVRQAPGLSLLETPQSLETLTIALRCPPRPDAPCLQRIGDQLHADHYVWGTLAKKKGGEVAVEAHYWSRGKAQVDASETFSENVKDPSDDALRAVAAKLIATLTGSGSAPSGGGSAEGATGTLVVHAGSGGGTVLVDGAEKGTLDGGSASIEVPAGSHSVTVRVPGFQAPSLSTNVKAGGEQEVSFALAPKGQGDEAAAEEAGPSKPFPVRKVVAYTTLGAGVILVAVAAVEALGWASDKSDSDTQRGAIPADVSDACSVAGTMPTASYASAAAKACDDSNDAKTKSTVAWVTGVAGLAAGGVGVFLLTSDHSGDATSAHRSPPPRLAVTPMVGQHEGGLRLRLQF